VALLCYLVATNEPQTRDTLAGLLWSDFPEHRARGNLRDALAVIRRTPLAPYVDIGRRQVTFKWELPHWIDTAEFLQSVEQGSNQSRAEAAVLEGAMDLYRGEFLAGFQIPKAALFEEWATVQRQHLHLQATTALQQLVDFFLDEGSYEVGVSYACRLLALDPWREQTHRNLMLLHLLNNDHHAALKQYEECWQILADELGIAPSPETQTLFQNIRKQINKQNTAVPMKLVRATPAVTGPVPHNIPGQVTPFIGREKEQRAIDNVLQHRTARLITILGVGGSGKTRLALAIGEKQVQTIGRDGSFRFADGVFFAPLEAIESPTEIVPALCQALRFQPAEEGRVGRTTEGQLLDYLRRKRLLLIIDNFEHLLGAIGLLTKIRQSTTDVHLLVTSRQKLSLQGERLYTLQGLKYPSNTTKKILPERLISDYAAAALFVACAQRVQADYHLREEEIPALNRLCNLVDGLPLALELAAGWANILSVEAIVIEVEQGLSFLKSDLRDLPDRHRSMEAVFEVSWRRLSSNEQQVFAQLCMFRGGFTRRAAVQVVQASLRQLAILVNNALLQYDKKRDRYQIHRLLRQFGAAKLALDQTADQAVRRRHCVFYTTLLQRWEIQLKGAAQLEAIIEFDLESANVREGWKFATETGQLAALARAADGLGRLYLWRRRFREGETAALLATECLQQALFANDARTDATEILKLLAKIKLWRSVFCDLVQANELVQQARQILERSSLSTLDTRRVRAFALQRAGDLAFNQDGDKTRRFYGQSLTLYRELGDTWAAAKILTELGWEAGHRGDIAEAQRLGSEALALVQATGERKCMADALWLLGTLAILGDRVEEATQLLSESLDIREAMGDHITDIATGPLDLGMTLTWIGRMAEANAIREETLALYEAQGQPEQIALAHVRLATSKIHMGDFEAVIHHARLGLGLCRQVGNQRGAGLALWLLGWRALYDEEFDQAAAFLQESLDLMQQVKGAAEIGWILGLYAEVLRQQGKLIMARKYICDALHTVSGVFGMVTILISCLAYMHLLADDGRLEKAIAIGSLLEKHPVTHQSRGSRELFVARLAEIRSMLSEDVAAAATACGRARDLYETADEVLAELEEAVLA
jgi:DNA-binding SARP family transcriptional activator/predicted ATPase/tetratricopeptide (TPR) repeat protein